MRFSRLSLLIGAAALACGPNLSDSTSAVEPIAATPTVATSATIVTPTTPAPVETAIVMTASPSNAPPRTEQPTPVRTAAPTPAPTRAPIPPHTLIPAPTATIAASAAPAATVIPVPQTPGPKPTWTATPNPALPAGVSGCVPAQPGNTQGTQDCVARGLPPGAAVTVTVNEVGGSSYFVSWLPPVDVNGNVPFPYYRPGTGTVIFTVRAGVMFETFFY